MSDKHNTSEEDYLDSLLRAITNEGGTKVPSEEVEEDLFGEQLDFDGAVGTDLEEEEFLSDFEKELNISDDTLLDIDSDILGAIGEVVSGKREEAENADERTSDEKISDEKISDENISEEKFPDENEKTFEEKALVEEAVDKEDSSIEEDLKGLYGILGMETAEAQLPDDIEETPKKKKTKKEKKEKKGFFSRKGKKKTTLEAELEAFESNSDFISNNNEELNIGLDDETSLDETVSLDAPVSLDDSTMEFDAGFDDSIFDEMSENEMLIQQMDDGDIDEEELLSNDKTKSKKKKGKKEKKEKNEKKEKKAKEKKKKVKKPEKEKNKKPKEPDEIIKIPVVFVVFAISFIVVVVLMAKIGGDYYNYNQKFYEAISLYVYGNELEAGETIDEEKYETKFAKAYSMLSGMEMKEKEHQVFYDQLETIMLMDRHYEAYKTYMLLEDFDHGLDSLIKAVKMYDKYQNQARELDCFDEMTVVLGWVDSKLEATYGITESQARELSMLTDDDEYAVEVRAIAETARSEYEKNKVEEE